MGLCQSGNNVSGSVLQKTDNSQEHKRLKESTLPGSFPAYQIFSTTKLAASEFIANEYPNTDDDEDLSILHGESKQFTLDDVLRATPSCFMRSTTPSIPEDCASVPEACIGRHAITKEGTDDDESCSTFSGSIGVSSGGIHSVGCDGRDEHSSMSAFSSRPRFVGTKKRHHKWDNRNSKSRRKQQRRKNKKSKQAVESSVVCDFIELQKQIEMKRINKLHIDKGKRSSDCKEYGRLLERLDSIQERIEKNVAQQQYPQQNSLLPQPKSSALSTSSPEKIPFLSEPKSWFFDFIKLDMEHKSDLQLCLNNSPRNLNRRSHLSTGRSSLSTARRLGQYMAKNGCDHSSNGSSFGNYRVNSRRRHNSHDQRGGDKIVGLASEIISLSPRSAVISPECGMVESLNISQDSFSKTCDGNDGHSDSSYPVQDQSFSSVSGDDERKEKINKRCSPLINVTESVLRITQASCQQTPKRLSFEEARKSSESSSLNTTNNAADSPSSIIDLADSSLDFLEDKRILTAKKHAIVSSDIYLEHQRVQ